jgi:hypothetical protein
VGSIHPSQPSSTLFMQEAIKWTSKDAKPHMFGKVDE